MNSNSEERFQCLFVMLLGNLIIATFIVLFFYSSLFLQVDLLCSILESHASGQNQEFKLKNAKERKPEQIQVDSFSHKVDNLLRKVYFC